MKAYLLSFPSPSVCSEEFQHLRITWSVADARRAWSAIFALRPCGKRHQSHSCMFLRCFCDALNIFEPGTSNFSSFCRFSKHAMHSFAGTNARGHDGSIFDGTQSPSNLRNMNALVHNIKYCNHKYIVYPGMHRTWNWNLTFDYISEPLRNWRICDRIIRFAGEVQNRIQTIRPRRLDIQCYCNVTVCFLDAHCNWCKLK